MLLVLLMSSCGDDDNTVMGPHDSIFRVTVQDSSSEDLLTFVFTQSNISGNISLTIWNVTEQYISSFDYAVSYSHSGALGWSYSRSGAGPIAAGESIDEGVLSSSFSDLSEDGFNIVVTSVVYGAAP
jgi:hypothetical protein